MLGKIEGKKRGQQRMRWLDGITHHLILCPPLLLLPSIFSSIRVFSNELALPKRWSNCWNFCFSVSTSNEYSGLISFRIGWFDLLAVQETLKNLLQHHNLKASVLQHAAFFMVQLSRPYMTTGKTITLTIGTFVGKLMSLLFKMLSRFVIAFFPRSKHLLISWMQSPSTVILEPIMTFRKLLLNTFIMLTILYCLVYIKTFPLNFKTKKSLI